MIGGPSPQGDRSPVRFDLTEASLEQYDAVLQHLRRHGHYHELDGSMLTVQERHADDVRALLANPTGRQPHVISTHLMGADVWARSSGVSVDRRTASRLARFFGAVIDGTITGLVVWATAGSGRNGELVAALAVAAGLVLMTAFVGASPGKLITRIRVEGPGGGAPGVPRAALRWAVTVLPSVAAALLSPLSDDVAVGVGVLGTLAVSIGILAHPEARGLHDMAAGTTVVRAGS